MDRAPSRGERRAKKPHEPRPFCFFGLDGRARPGIAERAAEHLRIARVVNLVRALEELKRQNIWVIGLDERGTADYDQFDFSGDCVLVLGREGAGLHDLVRRTCDHLLRIPMAGGVSSLNVSAAGAVVLYEAFRQRRRAAGRTQAAVDPAAAGASKPKKQKGLGS